jgi:O-methyltransferase involved in polyketide biosynthesis
MVGTASNALGGASETSLASLYWRAVESQRPDALLKDETAVKLVERLSYDFDRVRQIPMPELLRVMRIMLAREMDRYVRDFLNREPDAVVVHIGCGLDTRFERVDNGQAEWYDLDLPEVIDVRREFIADDGGRYHLLACSVLDEAWLDALPMHSSRPVLLLAETVFVYFAREQVKSVVRSLRERLPGAELVFDGWRPFEVWLGNRYFARTGSQFAGLMHWGVWHGREIEGWGDGIYLLDEWGFFDQPEPRLEPFRWMAPLFRLFKPIRIFRFRLGTADSRATQQRHRADSGR